MVEASGAEGCAVAAGTVAVKAAAEWEAETEAVGSVAADSAVAGLAAGWCT